MTIIKCVYTFPVCRWNGKYTRIRHSEYWWCDEGANDNCIGKYTPPANPDCINPQCVYCGHTEGGFEEVVKRYRYDDGNLKFNGRTYWADEIKYLEIDGRVLVNTLRTGDKE